MKYTQAAELLKHLDHIGHQLQRIAENLTGIQTIPPAPASDNMVGSLADPRYADQSPPPPTPRRGNPSVR